MSGWRGSNDYTFSNRFLGRSETNGFFHQQITENEGFIKHHTNISSNKFLTSISLNYNLTKKFNIYAETGTNGKEWVYGFGLNIPIGGINLYIPILTESGLIDFKDFNFINYTIGIDISKIIQLD